MSYRKVTTCARGSRTEPVTVVGRNSGPPRFVAQNLLLVRLRGLGAVGGTSAPLMCISSTARSSNEKRDGQARLDKKSDSEHDSVLMQVLHEKEEPKQLTTVGKGAFCRLAHTRQWDSHVTNHFTD